MRRRHCYHVHMSAPLRFSALPASVFCGVCLSLALLVCTYIRPGFPADVALWSVALVALATLVFSYMCGVVYAVLHSPRAGDVVVLLLSIGWCWLLLGAWFLFALFNPVKEEPVCEVRILAEGLVVWSATFCWPAVGAILARRVGARCPWFVPLCWVVGVLLLLFVCCYSGPLPW